MTAQRKHGVERQKCQWCDRTANHQVDWVSNLGKVTRSEKCCDEHAFRPAVFEGANTHIKSLSSVTVLGPEPGIAHHPLPRRQGRGQAVRLTRRGRAFVIGLAVVAGIVAGLTASHWDPYAHHLDHQIERTP